MIKSAMILAAGLGQRMRPITNTIPKPLISIAGKSMLDRAFDHLKMADVSHIVVNAHYLAPLVIEHVNTVYPQAFISHEDVLLETGGGIKKVLSLLGQDPFFVLNGDSVWSDSKSLNEMKRKWEEGKMDALLLLLPREKAYGYDGLGDFFMDTQGRLSRPTKGREAPYVYIGVQIVSPRLFQHAPHGSFSMNVLWDEVLRKDRLYGHVHEGEWFHISTPQDLEKYEPLIASTQA